MRVRTGSLEDIIEMISAEMMGGDRIEDFIRRYAKLYQPSHEHMNEMAVEFRDFSMKVFGEKSPWPASTNAESEREERIVKKALGNLSETLGLSDDEAEVKAREGLARVRKAHFLLYLASKYAFGAALVSVPPGMREGMQNYLLNAIQIGHDAALEAVKEKEETEKEEARKKKAAEERKDYEAAAQKPNEEKAASDALRSGQQEDKGSDHDGSGGERRTDY